MIYGLSHARSVAISTIAYGQNLEVWERCYVAANNNVQLAWNANTEPDLAGYIVFYTMEPNFFTTGGNGFFRDIGNITSYTFPDVTETSHPMNADGRWYFAVVAKDTSGNISNFSNVVSKRIIRFGNKLKRRK